MQLSFTSCLPAVWFHFLDVDNTMCSVHYVKSTSFRLVKIVAANGRKRQQWSRNPANWYRLHLLVINPCLEKYINARPITVVGGFSRFFPCGWLIQISSLELGELIFIAVFLRIRVKKGKPAFVCILFTIVLFVLLFSGVSYLGGNFGQPKRRTLINRQQSTYMRGR